MKYKCIRVEENQTWLTLGKIYDGDIVTSLKEFYGWIEIKKSDDGYPCLCLSSQFMAIADGLQQPSNV